MTQTRLSAVNSPEQMTTTHASSRAVDLAQRLRQLATVLAFALPISILLAEKPIAFLGANAIEASRIPWLFQLLPLAPAAMLLALAIEPHEAWKSIKSALRQPAAAVFATSLLIVSTFHALSGEFIPIVNFLTLIVYILYFTHLWRRGVFQSENHPLLIANVLIIYFALSFFLFGMPKNRWWGGMHPNLVGSACVAAACMSMFTGRAFRILILTLALTTAIAVSSRYAIACILLIFVVFYGSSFFSKGWGLLAGCATLSATAILGLVRPALFSEATDSLFLLSDRSRGFGSGISGRSEYWEMFAPQISEHPFAGFGFRNRQAYIGVHNGYGNLLLELGLIAGGIVIACFFIVLLRTAIELFRSSDKVSRRFYMSKLLGIAACLMAFALQPQILNFGDPLGVTFLLLLAMRFSDDLSTNSTLKRRY